MEVENPQPDHGDTAILIVEDDETIRGALTIALERHGYRVTAAESAEEVSSCAVR